GRKAGSPQNYRWSWPYSYRYRSTETSPHHPSSPACGSKKPAQTTPQSNCATPSLRCRGSTSRAHHANKTSAAAPAARAQSAPERNRFVVWSSSAYLLLILEIGDWRLEIRDWWFRFVVGALAPFASTRGPRCEGTKVPTTDQKKSTFICVHLRQNLSLQSP